MGESPAVTCRRQWNQCLEMMSGWGQVTGAILVKTEEVAEARRGGDTGWGQRKLSFWELNVLSLGCM